MPQVIPIIAAAAAKAAALKGISAAFIVAVASVASGLIQAGMNRQKSSKPTATESAGRQHIVRSSTEPHRIVVGEMCVSGPLVFADVTGSKDEYLHLVIPLAAHEVEEIGAVWLNDEPLIGSKWENYVRVKRHLGTADQAADSDLIVESDLWTDNHRLRGIAYVYVRLYWPENDGYEIWPNGIPNIKAVVKGAKYLDPRDDSTTYTNNAALAIRGYLVADYGMACSLDEIDDILMVVGANVCDEIVDPGPLADLGSIAESWQFKSSDEAFTGVNASSGISEEHLVVSATAVDPQFISPAISVVGNDNRFVRCEIRRTVGAVWDGRIFYSTAGHGFSGSFYTDIPEVPADGDFHYVEIDMFDLMSGGDDWKDNTITSIRFDFCSDSDSIIYVKWIMIGNRSDQKRYTVNGSYSLDAKPTEIIEGLLSASVGSLCYSQGEYKYLAGAYVGAEPDGLNESDLRASIKVRPHPAKADLFNCIRGLFISPEDNWQATDFPVMKNDFYISQDAGEEIWTDIDLPFTTNSVAAQRIAKIHLDRSRQGATIEFPAKLTGMRYLPGSVVPITIEQLGWANKEFRVVDYVETKDGSGVDLLLQEEAAAVYDWNYGQATKYDPAPDTNLPDPGQCSPPTVLSVQSGGDLLSIAGDGTVNSNMQVSWLAPLSGFVVNYQIEWQKVGDPDWKQVPSIATSTLIGPVADGDRYDIRVRALNGFGAPSEWVTYYNHTVQGKSAPPPAPSTFIVSRQPDGTREFAGTYNQKPADFAGYRIYAKLGTGQTLPDMALLNTDGLITAFPFESNQLAAGSYTFALTAVDTSGLESAPIYIETTLADPRIGSVAFSQYPESDNWPGTKTDCHVENNGWLEADSDTTWDTAPATWDVFDNWNSGAKSPIVYEHPEIDLGFDMPFVPLVSMIGDGIPVIEVQWRPDGGSYSAWVSPAQVTARYMKVRVTVTGAAPLIKKLPILLSAETITEEINDRNTATLTGANRIAVGDIRLPITKPFQRISQVQIALQSVGAGWSWVLVDKDVTNGPRVQIYNNSGVLADASIDAFIRGM